MSPRKPKRGRPPLPNGSAKATMFCIRLTPEERAAIDRAAERDGMRASEWARAALLKSRDPIDPCIAGLPVKTRIAHKRVNGAQLRGGLVVVVTGTPLAASPHPRKNVSLVP